jgi:RNase adaptor protein for sRNA GlmZ degradation
MLIVGLSGCGKTVLLLRMLVEPGFIDNDNLINNSFLKLAVDFLKNSLNRLLWNLNTRVIMFPQMNLPDKIINILNKHNVDINTRLPYHKRSAETLHKKNIENKSLSTYTLATGNL